MLRIAEYYRDHSLATRNRHFNYLNSIFNCGVRRGFTKNNPLRQRKKTKEPKRKVFLAVKVLRKIYNHVVPHLNGSIEVGSILGGRPVPSELLTIKRDQVDFENCVVWVYASESNGWRGTPISEEFRDRLLLMKKHATTEYGREIQKGIQDGMQESRDSIPVQDV
nr:hypothetical protein [Desulfobacterales bacterium]